jgi:2-oxo-3-hexenedioate decarboxylase
MMRVCMTRRYLLVKILQARVSHRAKVDAMQILSATEILDHLDRGASWPHGCGMSLAEAYEHALTVRELRIARGERPLGYKVGFTNRTIWPRYDVYAPIWGPVWDTTVTFCEGRGELSLARTCEPRIEPETVFGMRETPPANASLDELLACVEWFAPGFEIVQSHMPGWKFVAPDTAADGALHARLLVGKRTPVVVPAGGAREFEAQFAAARIELCHGDVVKNRGVGANVLDGPLHALHHFLSSLRDCPGSPDLLPGEIVTTGTWTDAWPVQPGEHWSARFDAPLSSLHVKFT